MIIIRRLTRPDAPTYRSVRLEGLKNHPDAFGSSWEEEVERPPSSFEEMLDTFYVLGAEREGVLVGVAGFLQATGLKKKHRGTLWGMYVSPGGRGRGAGAELVGGVIAHSKSQVEALSLTVSAHNDAAIRLYTRFGFVPIGLDPHALKIANSYVDEILMTLVH